MSGAGICDNSDLELGSELESDLNDNVYWRNKWLIDFNAGETQPLLFD